MRLFTALWPPPEAVAALAADVGPGPAPPGWRATDPGTWHVTLAFHGEADPGVQARGLERAAHLAAAPRLRLAGAGTFPGVAWAGVEAAPGGDLLALVLAAGGDPSRFVGHVTVLRARRRPAPDAGQGSPSWSAHRGPWWRAAEVLLVASEPGRGGSRYRVVHRVRLADPRRCGPPTCARA
jgi:RNA 2',3'-cyclic 3'-phosphodiesterase